MSKHLALGHHPNIKSSPLGSVNLFLAQPIHLFPG